MKRAPQYPPAFCPVHGIFEAVGTINLAGTRGTFLQDIIVQCPRCGRESEIVRGFYSGRAKRLDILVDPGISPEALAAIRKIAEAAKRGEITPDEAKREAQKIHPSAGRLFDIANWSDQAKATLYAAIIAAATAVTIAKFASAPSQTVIVQPVIERAISKDDLLSSSSLTNVPLPKPRPKERR